MKKIRGALLVGSVLFGLLLVGCSKKTNSNTTNKTTTTKTNTTTKSNTTNKNTTKKTNSTTKSNTTTKPVEKVTVEFDSYGGNSVSSQSVVKGGYASKPADPIREGFTFNGWFFEDEKWDFNKDTVTNDLKLTAKWTINTHTVTLHNSNQSAGTISGDGTFDFNALVVLAADANEGYSFVGWYEGEECITDSDRYGFDMPDQDIDYTAKWAPNNYTLTLSCDSIKGTTTGSGTCFYGQEVSISATPKKGYAFDGWYIDDEKTEYSQNDTFVMPHDDVEIEARFKYDTYTLTVTKNIDGIGTIEGEGSYDYNSEVTLKANTTSDLYTFDGWYINDEKVETNNTYEFIMPNDDLDVEARWAPNKYTLTIDNKVDGVIMVYYSGGGSLCEYGSTVSLGAADIPRGYSLKWTRSDGVEHIGDYYDFNMPGYDLTITLTPTAYKRVGNKIYFGTYPQSLVGEDQAELIEQLNTLAGNIPTEENAYNWSDYHYYYGGGIPRSNTHYYIDIDIDNDGDNDYRGVYFLKYRPFDPVEQPVEEKSCQDNNGYFINTVYWFSYDVIEWIILTESSGKACLMANLLLDSQQFFNGDYYSESNHNGGTGYCNNYELSDIRKWLNDDFYNTAFDALEKELIQKTLVDNSASSTHTSYNTLYCNDTNDFVFLLSYKEVASVYYAYNDHAERMAYGTEYAKAQGLRIETTYGTSNWLLRSPHYKYGNNVTHVNYSGYTDANYNSHTQDTDDGIRPALWIKL